MTDIVELLRTSDRSCGSYNNEAADEIELLRHNLQVTTKTMGEWKELAKDRCVEIERLRGEVERLNNDNFQACEVFTKAVSGWQKQAATAQAENKRLLKSMDLLGIVANKKINNYNIAALQLENKRLREALKTAAEIILVTHMTLPKEIASALDKSIDDVKLVRVKYAEGH